MDLIFPPKLMAGDDIRVVAPASSRALVMEHDHSAIIDARLGELGLSLSFGRHVDERDDFDSSAIESRVADLHDAFADPSVAGILTVLGGFNSNELLPYLDWDLIRANPKVFCGFSDITALHNAILAKSGLVTYLGRTGRRSGCATTSTTPCAGSARPCSAPRRSPSPRPPSGPTTSGSSTRTTAS